MPCARSGVENPLGQYAENKGFAEDLTEGKFSFPIVHAVRADSSNRQVLSKRTTLVSSLPWFSL